MARLTQLRASFIERGSLHVVWIVTNFGHPVVDLADDARADLDVLLATRSVEAVIEQWRLSPGGTSLLLDATLRTRTEPTETEISCP